MVMATRSGFDGEPSLPGCAPADTGGDGNSVTWLVLASARLGSKEPPGGSDCSTAGAAAVAMPADDMLLPSKRFQSEGGAETFQIFAGDSSSTPTWKSSRGLAGGW